MDNKLMQQRSNSKPQHGYISNDKQKDNLKNLFEFKELIQEQLPKMPEEYITRILFDFNHESLVLFLDNKLIAGCCFKIFEIPKLLEIVFLVVDIKHQTKGYGSQMIKLLKNKFLNDERNIQAFITCADDNAIEFFRRQGFHQTIESESYLINGFIKDYEGSKKMECLLDRKIKNQFEFDRNLDEILEGMKIDFQKQIDMNQKTLQINEDVWQQMNDLDQDKRIDYLRKTQVIDVNFSIYNEQKKILNDKDKMEIIVQEILKEDQVEIFMELVKRENVPEYYELIKNPISFNQIIKNIKEDKYLTFNDFEKDIILICNNAKEFNNDYSIFHKKAIQLERKFFNLKKKFVQLIY